MDNVFAQIKTTELKGSTFRSRILDFGDFDISEAEFKIVFKKAGNILPLTNFEPQKVGNALVIPYNILESYSGEIRMEAWMSLNGITDLAMVDTMLISAENQLKSDATNQNITVTFGDVVIPVTFTQAIVNIGGGNGTGENGKSAYEIAVLNGFPGTEAEWLDSLKGADGEDFTYEDFTPEQLALLKGADGKSAYQIALDNGFVGTQAEWLASLQGSGGGEEDLTKANKNASNISAEDALLWNAKLGLTPISDNSLEKIVNDLRNPQKKTIIKLLGDSITAGQGGTGYAATGPIIYGSVRQSTTTSTNWANMLRNYVIAKYSDKTFDLICQDDAITITSVGYTPPTALITGYIRLPNNSANATAKRGLYFNFYGNNITLNFTCLSNTGIINVFIDNVFHSAIDTYNATLLLKAFPITGLTLGSHVLRLEETNTKNTSASGTTINFTSATLTKTADVINFGISGINSKAIYDNRTSLISSNDDIIILQIGTNNRIFNEAQLKYDLINTYKYVTSLGKKMIIMASIPAATESSLLSMVDIVNIIEEVAINNKIPFISNYQGMIDYMRMRNVTLASLLADTLHPNDAGYKVMFEHIMKELKLPILLDGHTY